MKVKYFLYARKSTEDEERQVMSIEAQIDELTDFARREGIKISQTFIESKSAKSPGRPIFNEMLQKIYASKEQIGLLAWHPDRLARNSVDGGQIIYLIDIKKVIQLKFPTFWFEPTPQGLFMLQVAFGQSKYYIDNLSENVRRGMRQKVKRGEWFNHAPFGYVNNPKTRNIEPEPLKARIIKKAFKEVSEGKHSLESIRHKMYYWGLTGNTGKPLGKSSVHRILTNTAYLGLISFHGETHEGNFEPIIDKKTFDKVQKELERRSRPRNTKEGHNFPLTNLLTCSECGCAITAQYAKKGKYIYYRCSKRKGSCSQPYVRDIHLIEQLRYEVDRIALPEEIGEIMLAEIDILERKEIKEQQDYLQQLNKKVKEIEGKMDKLVNTFLDGNLEQYTYLKKKDELLKDKVGLLEKIKDFENRGAEWFELAREFVETFTHAHSIKTTDDFYELKSFVKKIGSNRLLGGKKVILEMVSPLDLIPEYFPSEVKERLGIKGIPTPSAGIKKEKKGGEKNKKTARQERLNLIDTEKVSLSRGGRIRTCDLLLPKQAR